LKAIFGMMFIGLFVFQSNFACFAQVGIITTYAGLPMSVKDAQATNLTIDDPTAVASDGADGFYVVSSFQNRVYRVSADGKISLIAGSGANGLIGDGGPAVSAQLDVPYGVAADSAGNIFITEILGNRIRKVTPAGIISTVAGNGSKGYSGDGGPAISAKFSSPRDISVDSGGNLFIADGENRRIRKVSSSGIITTVAGNGSLGYSGDGGPATSAKLYQPWGLSIDSANNLFIADTGSNCIRKVDSSGIITTIAGNTTWGYGGDGGPATSAQLKNPYGIAVDSAGNLFIADYNNNCIRKVDSSGIITTVAGNGSAGYSGDGGMATSAQLNWPYGVAVDDADNLYIADYSNNRIRKVASSGIITTVAGSASVGFSGDGGPSTSAQLDYPSGVALDTKGNLFIADDFNSRIRKVSVSGIITTVAGNGTMGSSGDGGYATSAQLHDAKKVAVDSAGNLYIADCTEYRIRKVSLSGIITTVAGNGSAGYSGDSGPATSAQLLLPMGVAADSAGNLFIADSGNHRIRKVSVSGIITTVAGNGSSGYNGDEIPATTARLWGPSDVVVDSAGNLFIADRNNHRIRKVAPSGIITTIAGNGINGFIGDDGPAILAQLYYPDGVSVDSAGTLFIADTYNHRIRTVNPAGIITTVAGTGPIGVGYGGYSGDGGPATSAQLYTPSGVAVDSDGNLFIADQNNNRIRKVSKPTTSINLALGAGGVGRASTVGGNPEMRPGYARATVNSGEVPYGTAVFSFKQGGVTVSEAGVPALPPTTSARVFIDYRSGVNAVPARSDAGVVDINTGIAVVNEGAAIASVTYILRDASGNTIAGGHGTIGAGKHFSCFIDQLKAVAASDFNLPENFQTAIQFGALDIDSDQPVSVLALRGTVNQRRQYITTTTPVADLTRSLGNGDLYFAQFADGGGYTTSLILMNTSAATETGTIQIMDDNGKALIVNQVGGTSGASFNYSIPPKGIFRFQTDGSRVNWSVGWIQLTPDSGTSTPLGSGIYGYNPGNVLVTESGVPSASATNHARIYVDRSGSHNTGLAVANVSKAAAEITIKAFQADGITEAGTRHDPLLLAEKGHQSQFAEQLISGLPDGFTGVMDISSPIPFAALTVRSLYNENNDYLMTTFPVADVNQSAPSPIVFPQIADGGGYETQFLLLSAKDASNTTINFYDNDGAPLAVGR
jgi:sugar lactone lactonase YvrE